MYIHKLAYCTIYHIWGHLDYFLGKITFIIHRSKVADGQQGGPMTQSMTMIIRTPTTNYLDIGWHLIIFHEKKNVRITKNYMVFVTTRHTES